MAYKHNKYIDAWIDLVMNDKIRSCHDQKRMIKNNLIPVLERDDVVVDNDLIEHGLSLQKYFPFQLIHWELFQFAVIAGVFLIRSDGSRDIYFHEIRDIMGRGSGKNGFIDFLAFYFLSPIHGIRNYNIDLIANGEDQAATSIADLSELIKHPVDPKYEKVLRQNYKARVESVTGIKTNSVFRLNTTSTKNKDSKRTGCVIYDEKHEYESTTNMNTLQSGLGKIPHDRIITITTDGRIRDGVLDREKAQNDDILSAYNPNNRIFVNYFHIEKEEEWNDLAALEKAIPSLNHPSFYSLKDVITREIEDMPSKPDYFPEFMSKRCNFPISNPETAVAEWDDIVACESDPPFEIEEGMSCIVGIDFSKTNDFVGCVATFRKDDQYAIKHHSFICSKSSDLSQIKAPLEEWQKKGYLTVVDEVEISPALVAAWIKSIQEHYVIAMLTVDSFRYSILSSELRDLGFDGTKPKDEKNLWLVRNSDIMKAAPLINSLFLSHRLHGFDRMMCWYTNNTKQIIDAKGNITYGKINKRVRKTDGFMAFVGTMCCVDSLPVTNEFPDIDIGVITY
ncbi:MAG: hypothetical protein IJ225_10460 [Solobacterium sp.]|nr:hypothetical protein [Solobacterium sp.]